MPRQPGDGYNLVISFAAAVLSNKATNAKISHDTMTDLKPIGQIGSDYGNLLIVNAASPIKNLKDLIAYAKSQSRGINYGSWGIGSGRHLVMETLKEQTGISMNHVPYKTVALFEQKQNSPAPLQKSPEAFAAMIQSELPVWRKLMQTTKIEGA